MDRPIPVESDFDTSSLQVVSLTRESGYESGGSSGHDNSTTSEAECTNYRDTTTECPPRSPQTLLPTNHCMLATKSGFEAMSPGSSIGSDSLPQNPLQWTTADVKTWLDYLEGRYSISNLDKRKFAMNGLGIAFIPKKGFVKRLGHCGVRAYQDYQRRLKLHLSQSSISLSLS